MRYVLTPLLLGVNSLSIVSIYAWFRVFDIARRSAGDGLGSTWGIASAITLSITAFVFAVTWRVEIAIALYHATEDKGSSVASRGMELQLRRMLVGMVGKSAMLAGIFSTHFAILDSLPLTLTASLWYMFSATALVFLVLVLGNMSSVFLRHCFCCNRFCRAAAADNPKAFVHAKYSTVKTCLALLANCNAWLLGMVYNYTIGRALIDARDKDDLTTDGVIAIKWSVCAGFFMMCYAIVVFRRKYGTVFDGFDGVHGMAHRTVRHCGVCVSCCSADDSATEEADAGEAHIVGFGELIDRSALYTAMMSIFSAVRFTVSPSSENVSSTGELVAALGSAKVGFLVAALVITVVGTFGAAWLEKQVSLAATSNEDDAGIVHLYDYVCDFGVQGLAYVIGRLWYAALTTYIDAKSVSSGGAINGVETDSVLGLVLVAIFCSVVSLAASIVVNKLFKGHTLVRKRAERAHATPDRDDSAGAVGMQESALSPGSAPKDPAVMIIPAGKRGDSTPRKKLVV